MLTIRPAQFDILGRSRQEVWENRMVHFVARDFPARFQEAGEPKVRQLIQSAVKLGAGFGIVNEGSLAGLVELMVAFGTEFELSPDRTWARKMMANQAAPPELRIHLMRERMMAASHGRPVVAHKFPKALD